MTAPVAGDQPDVGQPDVVAAAHRIAEELFEAAEEVDRAERVPQEHLDPLARAGLFGLSGPLAHGGRAAPRDVVRSVYEAVAGASGAVFFVWVQHHAPVGLLASSPNAALRDHLLPDLCAGRRVGAVAFAHLRRQDQVPLVARRTGGDLVVDGLAPWVTSWGIAHTMAVAVLLDGDTVVWLALPARAADGIRPSPPMALSAMGATSTVRVSFDGLRVGSELVIAQESLADWRARDRVATAQPHPAPFGVARRCTRLLEEIEPEVAAALEQERVDLRARSYARADRHRAAPPETDDADLEALVEARAASLDLAVRSAGALVAATGGRAMSLSHPAQRLAREATFYTIQAQTPALRRATLSLLASPRLPPGRRP